MASIRAQVDLVREPVKNFTPRIEAKFKSKLGSQATKGVRGFVLGGHRKAQWTLWVTQEATDLRDRIAIPLWGPNDFKSSNVVSLNS
jgi:hypothetical protein